jgi:beta-galactosidase
MKCNPWQVLTGLLVVDIFVLLSSLVAQPTSAFGAMETILYGVSYYPEYMPYERLEQDVQLMQQAGITVVRLGESSWGLWEPTDGKFEFAWMDKVVDRIHRAGINIIIGTPTYSIPAWLYRKHPEIVITGLDGRNLYYGHRQNTDLSNPIYRYYCERVIRQILAHYKDHPAVIGYQIDNETFSHSVADSSVQAGFIEYLRSKFKTVEELNHVWGLNYWGQRLNDWTEVPRREGIVNPGWKLEWERYLRSLVSDFLHWQSTIVNEYKRPDQFITHDLSGPPKPYVPEYEISRAVDIIAINVYHGTQDEFDGAASSMAGDYARSLVQANYLVTETNAQSFGADSKHQMPPYDGQLRLDVYTHTSAGANMVGYWHWHSLHYGLETYVKGVLSHDLESNRAYAELTKTAHELRRIGSQIVDLKRHNKVAILYSRDSSFGIQFMQFSDRTDYRSLMQQIYMALYRLNVGVDFVFPETVNLANYGVVVVPPLYVANDTVLKKLSEYVYNGGHVVLSLKSGFCNEYSMVRPTMAPGLLRQAAGFRYQEFSNLRQPIPLKGDPFQVEMDNNVSDWAEMLLLEGAHALAYYDHPFFGKYPAITRNYFGAGTLTYVGTVLSDKLEEKLLADLVELAGLGGPDQKLPPTVHVKHGTNRQGKVIHYYLNYSRSSQTFHYPYRAGVDLLTEKQVVTAQSMTLRPWDLVIICEN